MRRIVISTIGTSLLTNQINRANTDEKNWYNLLRDNANLSLANTPDEVLTSTKLSNKISLAEFLQLPEGWLIDPEEKIIMVFRPGKQPETKENQDNLPVLSSLEDLQLSAQDVFSWLSLN